MILISVTVLHKGSAVGRKLGDPVVLELTNTDQSCKVQATPPNMRAPLGSNQVTYRPQQAQPQSAGGSYPAATGQWSSNMGQRPQPNMGQYPQPNMGQRPQPNMGTPPTFGQRQQSDTFYGSNVGGAGATPSRGNTSLCNAPTVPIASLNPYQNKLVLPLLP